ncbi:hypothetical protein AAMO2058_001206800 [Amorphochlora amoebiformis]
MHHPSGHRSPPSGDYDSIKGANDRLRHFVVLGKLRWVRECVLKEKADVNYRDPTSGYTALHMAVYYNRADICTFLIKAKADVNLKSSVMPEVPPIFRTRLGDQSARIMVESGAEINGRYQLGYLHEGTLLHYLVYKRRSFQIIRYLVEEAKACLRVRDFPFGRTVEDLGTPQVKNFLSEKFADLVTTCLRRDLDSKDHPLAMLHVEIIKALALPQPRATVVC